MIEAGTLLQNRYRVKKQIGQGGMGAVYVATDERFGSTVAIKETLFSDENYCKAFEREARLLNSLRHPALPVVTDHFVEGNGQFIVMEYIAGEDLAEQLAKNGKPFPLGDVLIWADQLLDALEFLHNQESPVIHRDIKPQNLKLTKRNQIILLDFGLAKGNPTDVSQHTAAKSIFGYSPGYASLEQIQGTGTEPRSDLYSLSATLYHLLTGVAPTDALTRAMTVLNDQPDPLRPANEVNHQIPFGVAEVLQKAMALNAGHRPASAAIMRQLLEESDKTEGVAEARTIPEKAQPTNIFTQNTKLFTERNSQQSEIKTEILKPGEDGFSDSRETVLVNNFPRNTQTSSSKRRYVVGAAIFGFLALFGFGMIALNDNETDTSNAITNKNKISETNASSVNVKIINGNLNVSTGELANSVQNTAENLGLAEADPTTKKGAKIPEISTQKTPENSKNVAKGKNAAPTKDEPFIINDDEEGNVKIFPDRIETDEAIIESNRVILKKDGKVTTVRPLPPEALRGLTPEQILKLERLRKMQKNFPKPPQVPAPAEKPDE